MCERYNGKIMLLFDNDFKEEKKSVKTSLFIGECVKFNSLSVH